MKFSRTGIILCTLNYEACVDFYRNTIGLPVMFRLDEEHSTLTCFDMGGTYLMVEPGGTTNPNGKSLEENPVKLRFNVDDFEAALGQLETRGVSVEVRREVWGSAADFIDPDGNYCALRDEFSFAQQVK